MHSPSHYPLLSWELVQPGRALLVIVMLTVTVTGAPRMQKLSDKLHISRSILALKLEISNV